MDIADLGIPELRRDRLSSMVPATVEAPQPSKPAVTAPATVEAVTAPAKAGNTYTRYDQQEKRVAPAPLTTKPFAVIARASTAKEPAKPAIASKAKGTATGPHVVVIKRGGHAKR